MADTIRILMHTQRYDTYEAATDVMRFTPITMQCNLVFISLTKTRAGPRHKRTKRLLRAPMATRGPLRVVYMKWPFILFYFIFVIYVNWQW